jgi:FixJ family two-component response regulator
LSPKPAAPSGAAQSNPEGSSLPEGPTVFLIDEDDAVRDALALSLRAAGHAVAAFGSGWEFLDGYQPTSPACLVVDMDLSDLGAMELLRTLAASQPALPAIITSRRLQRRAPVGGLPPGRILFLDKPFGIDELLRLIRIVLVGTSGSEPSS